MRCIILALLAVGSISVAGSTPAAASYVYPYCLQGQIDGTDCSFSSYDQCMASASGRGVECIVNPIVAFAQQNQQPQPQRRARRSYNY
jgi:hypothetical protein